MMKVRIVIPSQQTKYNLYVAMKSLPQDVNKTVFLNLTNCCFPGRNGFTEEELQKLIIVARNFQRLPAAHQQLLLQKATLGGKEPRQSVATAQPKLDPVERDAWIKERVSDAASWVRDLRRLGVASASSYIFAGRRSAPQPPKDWANEVLYFHYCQELTIQDSVGKYLAGLDTAFVQLPDRRWHIKYRGEAIPPLADTHSGLRCIHSLIRQNFLDQIVVRDDKNNPHCVYMPTSSPLHDERQERNHCRLLERNGLDGNNSSIKSFDVVRGNQAYDPGARKVINGRSNPEDRQISRAINAIANHNDRLANALNISITRDSRGVLGFKDAGGANWVTDIPEFQSDAMLEKTPSGWLVRTPLSDEIIEIPPERERGMCYIARLLQQTGASIPVGLMANSNLLNALVNRPSYQKLFTRTYQRLVNLADAEFDAGTRSIIDAVSMARGYQSKYYEITHLIMNESPLAKFIGTGLVSLTPEGLDGVLYLLKKRLAERTMDGTKTPELLQLFDHMDKTVRYVRRYEDLALQIEPESNAARDKVQKAISSAIDQIWNLGEHSLGKYFEKHIRTGKLCSHDGPWLWEVKGLSEFPDVIELARDHIYMKLRRFARQEAGFSDVKRKTKARPAVRLR